MNIVPRAKDPFCLLLLQPPAGSFVWQSVLIHNSNSMDLVRYRAGEAIRWLETGAASKRKSAQAKSHSLAMPSDARALGVNVKSAAGALMEFGRGALTDLAHNQAMASEFVLHDENFEIVKPSSTKIVRYKDVKSFEMRGDKTALLLVGGSAVTIKPYAYVVAGRLKVPIGWSRNGIEVPYELLLEELSTRCGIELP